MQPALIQSSTELFILSNLAITFIAVFYNRYTITSHSSKLILSSFALACWVVPFILIRNYLPQSTALNVTWLTNIVASNSPSTNLNETITWYESLSPFYIFMSSLFLGLCLFIYRFFKHRQWVKELKQDPQKKLYGYKNGYPIYITVKVSNALITGITKPIIWINPKLNNSSFIDITLQHELTHIKHKDNLKLAFIELVQCFYWWNPLIKILASQLKEQIEHRCDFKSSQYFAHGFYRKQLAELIASKMLVSHSKFSSAIIGNISFNKPSANSNIRRLKSIKEKQKMNLFSKFFMSSLLITTITLLSLPISTITAKASESQSNEKGVSMSFNDVSVQSISSLIADLLHLELSVDNSIKNELISISLKDIPEVDLLKVMVNTLNISFIQDHKTLYVKSLPGGIKPFLVKKAQPGDIGALLDLKITFKNKHGESINTKTIDTQLWSHFERQFSVKVNDEYEVQFIAQDTDADQVFVSANVLKILPDGRSETLFNPKLAIWVSKQAIMEWDNDEGGHWKIEITPYKKKYYEVNQS